MHPSDTKPLLFQRVLGWLAGKARENRLPLSAATVFGFLAHGFAFTNKLINHDEANSLFSKGGTVALGRWGLALMDSIFPNVSMPWIYGIITIFLLAVSVCLLVHLIPLRSRWAQVLAAGLVMTFPSLTGTFGYMFTSSSYGAAFFLAVLAVWLIDRPEWLYWPLGLGCMIFSLGIYQAYICLSAGLLVLIVIRRLLDGENAVDVLRRGLGYVGFLILSLGIYYGFVQLSLKLTGQQMGSYAAEGLAFSPQSLLGNGINAYRAFFSILSAGTFRLIPTAFCLRLHWILLIIAAGLLVWRVLDRKPDPLTAVLLAAAMILFPLAVCAIYLFTAPASIHTLVLYGFVDVYLLILMLADGCRPVTGMRRFFLNLLPILCGGIITVNMYIANEAYLNLHLRYENAYAFYTSLIADIRQSPQFTEGSRLAVLGTWQDPAFYDSNLDFTNTLTGVTGFKPDSYSRQRFVEQYIGFSIPFASEQEQAEILASAEYARMPVYPYYGSMAKIGDIFVVKLS